MKTRYTPLVKIKKNLFDTSERRLAEANVRRQEAQRNLEAVLLELHQTAQLSGGTMAQLLQQRELLSITRQRIKVLRLHLIRAESEVAQATILLQTHLQTYEKFKYLEARELEALMLRARRNEQKELDARAIDAYIYRKAHT